MGFNLGRASSKAATNYFSKAMDGQGQSKVQSKNTSDLISQRSGHKKSDNVHSINTMKSFRNVTSQYTQFLKDKFGSIKGNLNTTTATEWLEEKLNNKDEEFKGSSANTYISQLGNLQIAASKLGNKCDIDLKDIAGNLRDSGYDLGKSATDRSFADANSLVSAMQNSQYAISASFQGEAGMRVDDAINSNKWQINQNNTITIHGSKNGLNYTTRELNQKLINKAVEAKEQGYRTSYTSYSTNLKEVANNQNQVWQGTHGLRYNYAQSRFSELQQQGYSYKESLAKVSLEMGHSRIEITLHYLNI